MINMKLNLRRFDEGATQGTSEGTGENNTGDAGQNDGRELDNVRYGKQDDAAKESDNVDDKSDESDEPEEPTFEELIKGKYKDDYNKSVQKILRKRFNENRTREDNYKRVSPIVDMLADKYGVSATDIDGIINAVQNDDAMYEAEALESGISVEQLKAIKRLKMENEQLRASVEQYNREKEADAIYQNWMEEAEEVKAIYPNFDIHAELADERFSGLLKNGIDVKTAYEVAHHDEIIQGAMQATANAVKNKVVNEVRSGTRPKENGVGSSSGTVVKSDPSKWSKEDMKEVIRRVERGEKITL
ncbi:MAG: hypothetical protein E7265_06655 [Lachnospiraceae bacterium]|nr:hypothetical protein [Lachnospiraceae bacterium]